MASHTSASASRHGLPASRIMTAAASSRRSRNKAPALRMIFERSIGSLSRQAGNAVAALAMACRAFSASDAGITAGALTAATVRKNVSRWSVREKSCRGSLIMGRPPPSPSTAGEILCLSAAPPPVVAGAQATAFMPCGDASRTSSETASENPARSHDWLDVFSNSLRTK